MSGLAETLATRGWTVPEGYQPDNVGACRSCGAEILWALTPRGRKAPLNRDGTSHFATCPQSLDWRKGGRLR